jgi:hypothetical protein
MHIHGSGAVRRVLGRRFVWCCVVSKGLVSGMAEK